jgi:hypothetical protein
MVDGSIVNANTIEMIGKFYRALLAITVGDLIDGNRVGRYTFQKEKYGSRGLEAIEEELEAKAHTITPEAYKEAQKELNDALEQAKQDLDNAAEKFKKSRGPKPLMASLVEVSCNHHHTPLDSSIFFAWCNVKEETEDEFIDEHVKTIARFNMFCKDLFNFLNDMIESCPRAMLQLKQRKDKWLKIKNLLPKILVNIPVHNNELFQVDFLSYAKKKVVDKLEMTDINEKKVHQLVMEYIKLKATPDEAPTTA